MRRRRYDRRCASGWSRRRLADRLQFVTTLPIPRGPRPRGPAKARKDSVAAAANDSRFDWRRIAYNALVSRALDDAEETTNKNKATVPRENLVLYQFSARGHEVAEVILGSLIDHRHDAASAYYRSRPLLLSLGLSIEDAFASPLGRAGGFSDGRDIGVVCNLPNRDGPIVLPMSGDVGSQYTPCAGWAQAIRYHADVLGEESWNGAIGVVLGGEGSVATNGFWSALTMATTLSLPMLFYIEDNGLGISVPGEFQTPGGDIAENLASFKNLFVRDGDGTDPGQSAALIAECVAHVRSESGPALVRLTVPRLCSHSGPDNQRGYRTDDEIASDFSRDPLPRLKAHLVPALLSEQEWAELESDVARDIDIALTAARARPNPDPSMVKRWVYADDSPDSPEALGGLTRAERAALGGSEAASNVGEMVRFAEAVRRALRHELEVNPKCLVFGEDVGRKGGVHLVTEGLQKQFGDSRVFDTSLSEEGIIGRAVGMAVSGLMPVTEIQFRKYADPATEQLNNCGTMRWRTANRFAAPIVVRMPGGYAPKCGDPWHSVNNEVLWAHATGWQVAYPSNAEDAVGLLRTAMRSNNPTIFFEHRALLDGTWARRPYPGDEFVVPFGSARTITDGDKLTVVTWGAMVERCEAAAKQSGCAVHVLVLRTIAPWDKAAVLA